MAQFGASNHCNANLKIIIEGAEEVDKSSLLEKIHQKFPLENRGKITCLTAGDKTLFVNLIPPKEYLNFYIMLTVFTLTGKVTYNSSRKLLLKKANGIIFVMDSQIELEKNQSALKKMQANAEQLGMDLTKIPIVVLWNKSNNKSKTAKSIFEKDMKAYNFCSFEIDMQKDLDVFPWLAYLTLQLH